MRFVRLVQVASLVRHVSAFAIAFGSFGCSSGSGGAEEGGIPPGAATCSGVAVERGSLGGDHGDPCAGLARADGVHVAWQPGSPATSAVVSYVSSVSPAEIAGLALVVRYRGDDATEPLWQWHARNVNGSWDFVGDNAWADNWVFTNHTFTIANPKNYVDADGRIQIRYTSETGKNSSELDLLAVTVTRAE